MNCNLRIFTHSWSYKQSALAGAVLFALADELGVVKPPQDCAISLCTFVGTFLGDVSNKHVLRILRQFRSRGLLKFGPLNAHFDPSYVILQSDWKPND